MATKTGCVYMITSPCGKAYIGKTFDYEQRMNTYKNGGHGLIGEAIEKHGYDAMEKTKLHDNVPECKLNELERECITAHNTARPHGFNIKNGGSNYRHSQETRDKIAKTQQERAPKHTQPVSYTHLTLPTKRIV